MPALSPSYFNYGPDDSGTADYLSPAALRLEMAALVVFGSLGLARFAYGLILPPILAGLIWGTVSDAVERKGALMLVHMVHAASYAVFGIWRELAGLAVSAVLFGLIAWSIPAIMSATCGELLGPKMAPGVLEFLTVVFGPGQAVGPSVAGPNADWAKTFAPAVVLRPSRCWVLAKHLYRTRRLR